MPYSECLQCRFYVSPRDARCPNCGLLEPLKEFESESVGHASASGADNLLAITAIFLSVVSSVTLSETMPGLWCVTPFIIIGAIWFVSFSNKRAMKNAAAKSKEIALHNHVRRVSPPESLAYKQDLINRRLTELRERQKKIKSVLERAKQNAGEKWSAVVETLNSTARVLNTQQARYSLKQSEIELVRWQNSLAPLLSDAEDLSYEQLDARLKQLERARFAGKQWLEEFRAHSAPLGETIEVKHLRERATDVLVSINTLHEAYVARQAADALKGITIFDDTAIANSSIGNLLHASDAFNIHVAITDFSAGFDELEMEYARLQSESEISKRLIES